MCIVEFHDLGLGTPYAISAKRGSGIDALFADVLPGVAELEFDQTIPDVRRIALLGRPNVGKSTLINRLVGAQRVVVSERPGTTRDCVRIPYRWHNVDYELIDTAGVRRRPRVAPGVEHFSVIRALQAVDGANVVILVIDAAEGFNDQDGKLANLARDSGRSIVIAVNKWDLLSTEQRSLVRRQLEHRAAFLGAYEKIFLSALHGSGIGGLRYAVERAYQSAMVSLDTADLNRRLRQAVKAVPPPAVGGRPIKVKFAHQGGRNPPLIVLHGNRLRALPVAYRRYLANYFRRSYALFGTNVKIALKHAQNPYA